MTTLVDVRPIVDGSCYHGGASGRKYVIYNSWKELSTVESADDAKGHAVPATEFVLLSA
jgi:hypothetical protein